MLMKKCMVFSNYNIFPICVLFLVFMVIDIIYNFTKITKEAKIIKKFNPGISKLNKSIVFYIVWGEKYYSHISFVLVLQIRDDVSDSSLYRKQCKIKCCKLALQYSGDVTVLKCIDAKEFMHLQKEVTDFGYQTLFLYLNIFIHLDYYSLSM